MYGADEFGHQEAAEAMAAMLADDASQRATQAAPEVTPRPGAQPPVVPGGSPEAELVDAGPNPDDWPAEDKGCLSYTYTCDIHSR